MLRIGVLGEFSEEWHTEACLARDFARLEDVEAVIISRTRAAWSVGYLRKRFRDCDLVIYSPVSNPGPELHELWRKLREDGAIVASHHLDLYAGLRRQNEITWRNPFFATDFVFTPDGDRASGEWFEGAGINHRWLPAAIGSDYVGEGTWQPELAHDVVFVGGGAGYPHPEWPFRRELVQALRRRYGDRYAEYGHGSGMRGDRLKDLYASARVVVGDSVALVGHRNYWSDRYYETIGRAGFHVAPKVPGISAHFRNGEHVWFYEPGNVASALTTIDTALTREPDELRAIARKGMGHVANRHTYVQRAEAILRAVGLR